MQLKGCPLKCVYCYVDDEGIHGQQMDIEIPDLIRTAKEITSTDRRLHVFHLMGGAPALHIRRWSDVAKAMTESGMTDVVFHSDIVLAEPTLVKDFVPALQKLTAYPKHLIAICIKGVTEENFHENIGTTAFSLRESLENLRKVVHTGINYYLTLVNPEPSALPSFLVRLSEMIGQENARRIQLLQVKPYNVTKSRFSQTPVSKNILEAMDQRFFAADKIIDEFRREAKNHQFIHLV